MAKSIKRTYPADAANIYIRNILCEISERLGGFNQKDEKNTLKFFDNKCPYRGKNITHSNKTLDHIEGHNRKDGGLHLYGNLVYCTKDANAAKSTRSYIDFLRTNNTILNGVSQEVREERIEKIQKFIELSKYKEVKSLIIEKIRLAYNIDFPEFLEKQYQTLYHMTNETVGEIISSAVNSEIITSTLNAKRKDKAEMIKMWSGKPNLKHHKTIALYLQMSKENLITREVLVDKMKGYAISKNPYATVSSMMTDAGNAYGAVFMIEDEFIVLRPEIEEYIMQYNWIL